jgi:hypothetical protein
LERLIKRQTSAKADQKFFKKREMKPKMLLKIKRDIFTDPKESRKMERKYCDQLHVEECIIPNNTDSHREQKRQRATQPRL